MGRPIRKRLLYGKLPRDVEEQISKVDIENIWELLNTKFGFNLVRWQEDFQQFFQQQPHSVTIQEAFVEYGQEFINPVLNRILKRDPYYATWSNLLKYIVKKH